jgi:hypothetical protein
MIRTAYITKEEAVRLLMEKIIEEKIKEGWEPTGFLITEDDPMGDGINGWNVEQGTTRAMLVTGQADEENR